ncbi:hypothetical protein H4I96_05985 [Botrytis cinerea]
MNNQHYSALLHTPLMLPLSTLRTLPLSTPPDGSSTHNDNSTNHQLPQSPLSDLSRPDHWWDEFLAICALSLHPRFCHSNTSVWNFYNTLQIREMRSEYLTGGRSFTNETGEVCNWLAFCLRELRNQGIEWNLDASGSSSGTRRERRERRQDDSVPWLEWWWDGDIVRFTLND